MAQWEISIIRIPISTENSSLLSPIPFFLTYFFVPHAACHSELCSLRRFKFVLCTFTHSPWASSSSMLGWPNGWLLWAQEKNVPCLHRWYCSRLKPCICRMCLLSLEFLSIQGRYTQCIRTFRNTAVSSFSIYWLCLSYKSLKPSKLEKICGFAGLAAPQAEVSSCHFSSPCPRTFKENIFTPGTAKLWNTVWDREKQWGYGCNLSE